MFVPHMHEPSDPADHAHWFVVRRGEVLVVDAPEGPVIPTAPRRPPIEGHAHHVLGSLHGVTCWGVDAGEDPAIPEPAGHRWVPLRALYGQVDDLTWTVAGRAEQIVSWDRTNRFCGRCGTPTERHPTERARVCPSCRQMAFPRLSPAIITLVERGERGEEILLAQGRQFRAAFYSTLAGFVEPGESLEEAVTREVHEETGVDVTDVRYFGSQPWPFPNSLMIGFQARYAGGELALQEEEIVDAGWYTAENLPPHPEGGMSIAGWLIADWLRRQGRI